MKKSPYVLKPSEERTTHEIKYGNDFERNVYIKGELMDLRAQVRYFLAGRHIKSGMKVLDIGCSNGYGTTMLPQDIIYKGIDYDANIIQLAQEQFGNVNHTFQQADATEYPLETYDVIIAYEFLEHIKTGISFAQKLKDHCDQLFCTVPYKEIPGFWGPHHLIHNLTEVDFPGFEFKFISFEGVVKDEPDYEDGSNLMMMKWSRS